MMCVCAFLPWCAPPPFAARRGVGTLAYCGGGRGAVRCTARALAAARRSEVSLAGYSGGGFPPLCAARGAGGCAAERSSAGGLQRRGLSSALRRAGWWRLRGGAGGRWPVAAGGAFSALRRAGCCVGAGPAGRCGRFSCFAHAPLIKKSGQKRNQGLLWPAPSSGWSVSGARASAALRAVSVGGRGKKFSFVCVGKVLGMDFGSWVCGACAVRWGFSSLLPRKPLPPRCAARGVALARGPRGAATAFLASLMRR